MASASSDEGEIIEGVTEDLKVASLPRNERNGVDRPDRPPSRQRYSQSKSLERDGRHESSDSRRSRSPRGYKRPRDDNRDQRDYRGRGGGSRHGQDNRRFQVHYEEPRNDFRRNRVSYEDIDRPPSRGSNHGYAGRDRDRNRTRYGDGERDSERDRDRDRDRERERDRDAEGYRDRDGHPEKRPRHRSPEPQRARGGDRRRDDRYKREDRRFDRQGDQARAVKYENQNRDSWKDPASKRVAQEDPRSARREYAKPGQGYADETQRESTEQATKYVLSIPSQRTRLITFYRAPEPEPEEEEEPEPFDEDAEIERRRRRREALLAKSSSATPLLVHAVTSTERSNVTSPDHTRQATPQPQREESTPASGSYHGDRLQTKRTTTDSPAALSPASNMHDRSSPEDMDIVNDNDLINTHGKAGGTDEDGPSAADYDPTNDMREDGRRDEMRNGQVGLHGEVVGKPDEERVPVPVEGKSTGAGDNDDEDFNMFAEDFDLDKYAVAKSSKSAAQEANVDAVGGLLDGQDKDGYYKLRPGEVLNGRYQVQTSLGKGMFSGVVRAVDITNKQLVAIKIMRKNDALRKGGFTEIAILQKLNESDPDGRKHIVRFYRHFDHQGHLCMTFENLSLNLREVLKRFGNNVGINLPATRAYAYQIFVALTHMRKCAIIHADLKPDNILVCVVTIPVRPVSEEQGLTYHFRSTRVEILSRYATWVPQLIGKMRRRRTTSSRHTSLADSIARLRLFWASRTTTPSTCGRLDAPCTSYTRARFYLRATATIRC